MFLNLKKAVAIFLASVMFIALTACKEEAKPKNASSKPANNNFTIAAEDDTKDPENTENNKVDGEKVDISEIQAKKGLQNRHTDYWRWYIRNSRCALIKTTGRELYSCREK